MKIVIQRAKHAKCIIDDKVYSEIDNGLMLLVGFSDEDTDVDLDWYVNKVVNMRIFEDENNKLNLSVLDVGGQILSISQFTLYADCIKGNRPSFIKAMNPEMASNLYDEFNNKLSNIIETKTGVFGAEMHIDFTNDGPVTIILEK